MLEKMGWKKGEGFGKDGGGMKISVRFVCYFIFNFYSRYIYWVFITCRVLF